MNRDFVVVTGDLNLNRLRPDKPEGKLLLDLEVEQGFECLITKPTRIEKRGIKITESLRTCPHEIQAISKFESTWYPPEFDTILCTYCYKSKLKACQIFSQSPNSSRDTVVRVK